MSLATKYRPEVWSDIVGQERVIKVLTNQLEYREIKPGYLFTGSAGTGKTTIARILAKDVDGELYEIDAASNTGVDNVRGIRESCQYKPLTGKYKVYVIDECHMLSTGAWNALLKTLEEPPAHVVFILCTTDPQKIPATILSRVQRFDLKRLTTEQIVERLQYIINEETREADPQDVAPELLYEVEDAVLAYIAKRANGGLRDAISLFDMCKDYANPLTLDDVKKVLGVPSLQTFLNLTHAILQGDMENVVVTLEESHEDGHDMRRFIRDYQEFLLDIAKTNYAHVKYTQFPESSISDIDYLIQYMFQKDVNEFQLFDVVNALYNQIKHESNPVPFVEGALMSLCKRLSDRND